MILVTVLCSGVLLLPSEVLCADSAEFLTLGFSKDGKYYACEQYGVQDGSGFPYSEVFFVEVGKNGWAKSPIRISATAEKSTLRAIRAEVRKQAAGPLNALGIVPGENRGELSFTAAPGLDPVKPNCAPQTVSFKGQAGDPLKLVLSSRALPESKTGAVDLSYGPSAAMRLMLSQTGGTQVVLQDDREVVSSCAGARGYTINRVIQLPAGKETRLVVVLAYLRPGFEGLDVRYSVVTSTLTDISAKPAALIQAVGASDADSRRYSSPDGQLTAIVASRGGESVVTILDRTGKSVGNLDLTSAGGIHGVGVVNGGWTPDSNYFVFAGPQAGGHSPWKVSGYMFHRVRNAFLRMADIVGGPLLDSEFTFGAPDRVTVVKAKRGTHFDKENQTVALTEASATVLEVGK